MCKSPLDKLLTIRYTYCILKPSVNHQRTQNLPLFCYSNKQFNHSFPITHNQTTWSCPLRPDPPLCALTFRDRSGSSRLGESIALTNGTAKADIHESLCGCGQWSTPAQQNPNVSTEQTSNFPENKPKKLIRESQDCRTEWYFPSHTD